MDWSKFNRGIFLVNVLGIVYNKKTKKILIGKREKDPYVKQLSWTFPGGRPAYKKELEEYLKDEIKKKTGLKINVKQFIFARIPKENKRFLLIYFYCEVVGGKEKASEKFVEIKWIKPLEVEKYFTTSLHPALSKFLRVLK